MNQKRAAGNLSGWHAWPATKPRAVQPDPRHSEQPAEPTAELQLVRERAYREAYAVGLEAGRAAGGAQLGARAEELEALFVAVAEPLAEIGAQLEAQLTALVTALVRQLVRRELRTEPDVIVAVVREAIELLPVSQQRPRVHLHPEDAGLLRELLHLDAEDRAWTLVPDPAITRGGCRVRTDDSSIDASLETRIARLCAAALGGERSRESAS